MSRKNAHIRLRGVHQNNLKGFDLDFPIGQLTVVTGLSGAGKSSLVFETLHAEGQRRYVETFSPYTRQFMDLLDRPKVDSVENIRPSIAIQQSNTVKTSRSTVGTITELADYFKVWFANSAQLHDPATGQILHDDNPQSIWRQLSKAHADAEILITFPVAKPKQLTWTEILQSLSGQGYARVLRPKEGTGPATLRIEALLDAKDPLKDFEGPLVVVQDRITRLNPKARSRVIEACQQALNFGKGRLQIHDREGHPLAAFTQGLSSPKTGATFRPASPALFSFNSPIGACSECRGFGRVIEIDEGLVIPDTSLSIDAGAIRAFQGEVYSASLRDLQRAAKRHKIRTHVPWSKLKPKELDFIMDGEPDYEEDRGQWYGVRRFFGWLNTKLYKMHVRVFLSKFRSYTPCPQCGGARLQPESLNWKWQGHTLPDLYQKSVAELLEIMADARKPARKKGKKAADAPTTGDRDDALAGIFSRLGFLEQVGLGYLTLDRSSRSLSGGETMRVNLTSCLGSSLVDTLFVLDEPSVGLHARDMDRLIGILRRLTDLGNTVVVVEHDEAVMRAADNLIEIGPQPGSKGGELSFKGSFKQMLRSNTHTGRYLSGRTTIDLPEKRRIGAGATHPPAKTLSIFGASKHNIHDLTVHIPQQSFVCLSGVSGSGKSTLLNHVIYQNLLAQKGLTVESPAAIKDLESSLPLSDVVLIDQSPVSKTPRSNPASYSKAWDEIRKLFAQTDSARSAGMGAGHFSFNSGDGRCPTCSGLGFERIEMQFVSDLFVPCESCEGRRFKDEVLDIHFNGRSIADILELDIDEACLFFGPHPKVIRCLQPLVDVGLGYLKLGQALNTLSGGESQRLKLVSYLGKIKSAPGRGGSKSHAMILIDEPTTGLHRADVKRLITVLQSLVDAGNSLIVIEHNIDILKVADWIIELGPGAGAQGGQLIAEGTPEQIAQTNCQTAPYLHEALHLNTTQAAAEDPAPYKQQLNNSTTQQLNIRGAREHNLKNISTEIPHNKTTVITGVSGSGKSTLAFDIIFAEGQRRFMESMSAYARQFVEQMPRAEVDSLQGIAPTVAIEQRVTKGTRKSTVATITEVAQYLRLLYARIGVQHSPTTGEPVVSQSEAALQKRLKNFLKEHQQPLVRRLVRRHVRRSSKSVGGSLGVGGSSSSVGGTTRNHLSAVALAKEEQPTPLHLCAPLIRGRKGHHEPLANWARDHGYTTLRIDGQLVPLDQFKKLDRYVEHDIELVITDLAIRHPSSNISQRLSEALRLGKGTACLVDSKSRVLSWLSTKRTDPNTGEAFPELDPKHFSWNSPRGWCPTCRGYGQLFAWMAEEDAETSGRTEILDHLDALEDGATCPDCQGARLNPLSRAVRLPLKKKLEGNAPPLPSRSKSGKGGNDGALPSKFTASISLPELLALTPTRLLDALAQIKVGARARAVLDELMPEIEARMRFMKRVGLDYLGLDRATATLSGGEAQRIRLAAQLGSNLSGVLYVLDEPSIGLHARDNARLLDSMDQLRQRGNTLVIVEHNEATMRRADQILDLGPGAGIHGGEIVASGKISQIKKCRRSRTGDYLRTPMPHPLRGAHRPLPDAWSPRKKKAKADWIALQGAALRNLKGFDLHIAKRRLNLVCGVSGAGKSTLIRDLLKPLVESAITQKASKLTPKALAATHPALAAAKCFRALHGADDIRKVIEVDQSPIGKTSRSTPATYIGAFDIIRDIFAQLPEANMRGFTAGSFSFNTKGGRCETCKGAGRVKLEMNFMPDTYVTCEDCNGRRYGSELDALRWNGKSIADVLQLSFEEAAEFFSFHTQLSHLMQLMVETGLGYIELGQYSPTLSGGEAQRLKLVSELAKGLPSFKERQYNRGQGNLYILEEPTIGLHLSDVERLIELLHQLVDKGHTVIVIEHHLELIADADHLIEIGPEGGEAGGQCLYQGNVPGLRKMGNTPTADFLPKR